MARPTLQTSSTSKCNPDVTVRELRSWLRNHRAAPTEHAPGDWVMAREMSRRYENLASVNGMKVDTLRQEMVRRLHPDVRGATRCAAQELVDQEIVDAINSGYLTVAHGRHAR